MISYLAVTVMVAYILSLTYSNAEGSELKGKYVCTKVIRYEDKEVYYVRHKCTLKDVLAEILKINKQCTFKNKYITKKKYRTVHRYKKVYFCCNGYVKIGYKCVKGKTTKGTTPTTSTTVKTTSRTTQTTTTTTQTTPTTTQTTPTTMNMTTTVKPMKKKIPVIVIILVVITVIVVVMTCLLFVVCCFKCRNRRKNNGKCDGDKSKECIPCDESFEHLQKKPLKGRTNGNGTEHAKIYNEYDSCEFSTNAKPQITHYDNHEYQGLHHYGNTMSDQGQYAYTK